MNIATWNVNSLKVRLDQVLEWLQQHKPDILCLQETKLTDPLFPLQPINEMGYTACFTGQKTYNGVAILSRMEGKAILSELPGMDDPQKRFIAATFGHLRIVCTYFPNGQSLDSEKFAYKMQWIQALLHWLEAELKQYPHLLLAGDFNIAPQPADAHPDWPHAIHVSDIERQAFQQLLDLGLADAFRHFDQPEASFTWWDYRMQAFRRNMGLRIDHILVANALLPHCQACGIDRNMRTRERPSDHAPVWLDLKEI